MRKSFFKNLFRDIKKTLSRFLSIVIIIAIGVSFYAGVRSTSPDMKRSGDVYFQQNNLMDYKLISTLGLTDADLKAVKNIEGIADAKGSYSLDAVTERDEKSLVLNINSVPDQDEINKIKLISGRLPSNPNEAVVEAKFLKEYKLKLGDSIEIKSGTDKKIEDNLTNTKFTIVGTAQSPLYISAQRQLSSIGNGAVRGFMYILPSVFKSEVYTEIYVKANSNESKESLSNNEEYKTSVEKLEEKLKSLGEERGKIRYQEVLDSANKKIQEAEDKLNKGKKEAETKFADGYKALDDAKNKLAKGEQELKDNEALFNQKMKDGEKQIEDGKKALSTGEDQLNSKAKELEAGKLQLQQAKIKLQTGENNLIAGKQKAASNIDSAVAGEVAKAKALMDSSPNNPLYIAKYNTIKDLYENDIRGKDFDTIYDSLKQSGMISLFSGSFDIQTLKNTFDNSEKQITSGKQQLAANEKALAEGEAKINAGRAELEKNKAKIAQGELSLNKAKQDGLNKLAQGKLTLENGKKELEENTIKIKAEEEKAKKEISDGEAEINKNKQKLKDLKNPEWYVLGRNANVGYETYRQDSDRIDNIGKAFPLIFFLVAALVSLTTMTRMVQENRIEIGTFKALGYSRLAIVSHYLIYSFAASLIGSLLGISFGFKLFPPLIMNAYSSLYAIPNKVAFFNVGIALQACLIAILFTTIAAVGATVEELREVPASLLRPKPPKAGKKIFLEYVPFIWRKLKFTQKVTARNIFRYKQRFFMTVIGIGACTGLMVTGFGLKQGIVGATQRQFNEIYKYHMTASLKDTINFEEKNDLKDKVLKDSNIKSTLFYYSKNSTAKKVDSSSEDAYLIVPENSNDINKYIELSNKDENLKLDDNGVIITQKLSKLINKKLGDTFELTVDNKVYNVKISAITEHYIQHYIYMSPNYYQKVTGKDPVVNSFYGLLKNTSEASEELTSQNLKTIDKVNSVSFKNNVKVDFNRSMDSVNSVVLILIISAGILAFVVIYNLTNININERRRELATIKLLGFYNNELAAYIYRENIILTVLGSLAGIFIGIFLDTYVVSTAETNVMMFMRSISPIYFLYSILLTLFFSIVVNVAMYKRFDKIDMIESLKSAE